MSQPIVFIGTHKIKPGKFDGFKERNREVARLLDADKPGTVAFLTYVNEDRSEVSFVHVFPDAKAMEAHMEGASDRAKGAAEFLEFDRLEVWGRPSDTVVQTMKQASGSGVSFRMKPEPLSGYIRLESC